MKSCILYIKNHLAQLILFMFMAASLSLTMTEGFFIDMSVPRNIALLVGGVVVLSLVLFAAASSRRAVVVGIFVVVGLAVATYLVLAVVTPMQLFADSYDNPAFVFHVTLVTTVILFLFTRRRGLLIAAFVIGAILCAAIQFLYGKDHIIEALVFLISCASYIMLLGHAPVNEQEGLGVRKALAAPLAAVGVCAAACALASIVFFGIIAPLHPPAHELKLITEYYALEEVHVSGLTDIIHMLNKDLESKNTEDDESKSNKTNNQSEEMQGQSSPSPGGTMQELGAGMMSALGEMAANLVRYLVENWFYILLVALLVLALLYVLLVALRRWLRQRKLAGMVEDGPYAEVAGIYRYVCNGYEAGGVCTRGTATPAEMARNARHETDRFEQGDMPLNFAAITELFSRATYGASVPNNTQLEKLREYYRAFPKHMMHFAGKWKYLRLFFKV